MREKDYDQRCKLFILSQFRFYPSCVHNLVAGAYTLLTISVRYQLAFVRFRMSSGHANDSLVEGHSVRFNISTNSAEAIADCRRLW